jgi:predicted nucleotidyltransferase
MFEQLIARLARALDDAHVPYIIIGGQAVLQHGEPRFTRDIDVSLGVDSGAVDQVLNAVTACGLKPLVDSPRTFVERTYILPVHDPATEIRVDFAFTFSPFEREAIGRALRLQIGGYTVAYATAEDLIIHKLFAGRPRDIEDIRGVLARKQGKVDRDYMRHWIRQFAQIEGKGHLLSQLEELLSEW